MAVRQDEGARLHALRQLRLLETPASESFDRITRMASRIFGVPIAAVSLTDENRQWFKSRVGFDAREAPRLQAPCSEVAGTRDVLVIPDLLDSPAYRDSLLAQSGIRFYAGAPLVTRQGFGLGAICVLGPEPRAVTQEERGVLSDLAAMVMAQIELQHAFGRIEPSSGLPNRDQLFADLDDAALHQPRRKRALVVFETLDAHRLRDALRVLGSSAIDRHVQSAVRALEAALGPRTALYHVGRTQLAWVAKKPEAIERLVQSICVNLAAEAASGSARLLPNPVVGIAPFRPGEIPAEDLLRSAYTAGQDARDRETLVSVYSEAADGDHKRRFRLLGEMEEALAAQDQLWLAFQPRVNLASGACVGAEALLRWDHPVLGNVPPSEFVPCVEQTDLGTRMTEWVLRMAIRQAAHWRARGMAIPISINVSAVNLEDPVFAAQCIELLRTAGLPPQALEIEVTESAALRDGTRAGQQLRELRAAGIRVAIDDFGTGYSTLAYLRTLPADVVKIDQVFIRELVASARAQTLVSSMIALAASLDFQVVAEGVEDEATYRLLQDFACDEVQGYFVSRPLTPSDFEAWLTHWSAQALTRAPHGSPERRHGTSAAARSAARSTSSPRQGFLRASTPSGRSDGGTSWESVTTT